MLVQPGKTEILIIADKSCDFPLANSFPNGAAKLSPLALVPQKKGFYANCDLSAGIYYRPPETRVC